MCLTDAVIFKHDLTSHGSCLEVYFSNAKAIPDAVSVPQTKQWFKLTQIQIIDLRGQ